MLSEETKKILREKGREDLIEVDEINHSGYAGCNRNGTIVDRRKEPDAVPVQENKMFGVVKPTPLPNEPHPEFFRETQYKTK